MGFVKKQKIKSQSRRQFMSRGFSVIASFLVAPKVFSLAKKKESPNLHDLKIAMAHSNPKLGELAYNCNLIELSIRKAASAGAEWVITPELCLTGYRFDQTIGVEWIKPGPDQWVKHLQKVAAECEVNLFLGHLEKIEETGHCYNTVFVINEKGNIIGRHKKINIIPVSESWSQAGTVASPIKVGDYNVGVLICADAWPSTHTASLKEKRADIIVSCANWAPGQYGPKGVWEKRSIESGLVLFVCNRTGIERDIDMTQSKSVVVNQGVRVFSHSSVDTCVVLLNWDGNRNRMIASEIRPV